MICLPEFRPMNQAGKRLDASSDLPCRGGIRIISRLISPRSSASSFSAINAWCGAATYAGFVYSVKGKSPARALRLRSNSAAASCGDSCKLVILQIRSTANRHFSTVLGLELVAVHLRPELAGHPLAGVNTQPRPGDYVLIGALIAVSVDVRVALPIVGNLQDVVEQHISLSFACARVLVAEQHVGVICQPAKAGRLV